ncbi:MAG TPA: CC/Se motif family (seleno)protein [Symbiobacteriaceae bacterium]|nr:CC/Se motif family (seleno)protein [Symbiobacteriaceae bacterium]
MPVTVTAEARQYLSSRSRHVTIRLTELTVQCCVPYSPPALHIGEPDKPEEYLPTCDGEITVHIPRAVAPHQPDLTIGLSGFGPFKALSLSGWRAFGGNCP